MPAWARSRLYSTYCSAAILLSAALLDPQTSRAQGQEAPRRDVAATRVPAENLPPKSLAPGSLAPGAAPRKLSPFYHYTRNYQGALWSHPGDIRSHLKDDLVHHGFSDEELRGLSFLQMERLHSAHHHGFVAPGRRPAETVASQGGPRETALGFRFRGSTWLLEGNYREAHADYQEALRLDPANPMIHSSLAWFYASCADEKYRDGELAVEFARRACESSKYTLWYQLNTLAAAYAEAGDFESAREWGRKAFDLAPEDEKPGCQERLQLYARNSPLRPRAEELTSTRAPR